MENKSIRVDVSEIKTYKSCRRQWLLSSRNRFHLRPMVTPAHFELGTIFHEALAQLYLGVPVERVMEDVKKNMKDDSEVALLAMIPGYAREVLPGDLDRFKVLDIEHHFEFVPADPETGEVIDADIEVCGSIDMIVLDPEENAIYGFEHKTCKNFRDASYIWMDEQPRVYTYALKRYVEEYNAKQQMKWQQEYEAVCRGEGVEPGDPGIIFRDPPQPVTLGGVYLNEVKKLLRQFQFSRTLCKYPEDDLKNFMYAFFGTCCACHQSVATNDPAYPSPSYMGCSMCDYKTICETYMYSTLDRDTVLAEFKEEFKVREVDHLEEKEDRSAAQ